MIRNIRFEMHLDKETADQIDEWRARQVRHPSRSEAARRLIRAGLDEGRVKFSPGEKQILLILCGIYGHLGIKSPFDQAPLSEAVQNDRLTDAQVHELLNLVTRSPRDLRPS